MIEVGTILERNGAVEFRSGNEDGGVLFCAGTGQYHGVNSVGALVWQLLQAVTFGELISEIRRRLIDPPGQLEDEICEFVEELIKRDLVRAVPSP